MSLVLHIGTGKTGTSTLQLFLRRNRERLAELGVLYPSSPGKARHGQLSLYIRRGEELANSPHWHRPKYSEPVRFRKTFRRRLFAEIETSHLSRVLLSDEEIFKSTDAELRRLHRLTTRMAHSLRAVAYLRRQDDHMVSRYQQGVKIGWVVRLRDFAQEDMSGLYDYHARLVTHRNLLKPDALVVRRFDPELLTEGSLIQDFLEAAGIEARADQFAPVPNRNVSLDAESVEFLRLLNLHQVAHRGATPGLIDNRALSARLSEVSTGPTLTLPGQVLDAFMAQWDDSNREVARRHFGDEPGPLFPTARKSAHTTIEQRLDPKRVGHFVEAAQLPGDLCGPLRRLAESEADRC